MSSSVVYLCSLWEIPSTLGTNSITVGTRSFMFVESCPARVMTSLLVSPRSAATLAASSTPSGWYGVTVLAPEAAVEVLEKALASDAAEPALLARIASGEPLESVLAL